MEKIKIVNDTLLQCQELTKSFKGFRLGPISATFPEGKVTGIFGPNGAEKSTLISLLMGILEKDTGEILSSRQITCSGVFERPFLLPRTRVIDQVEALCVALKRNRELRDAMINECGLQPYVNHKIAMLSTGNKQRLGLALALIQNPDIYILDEPLNGLDPDGIEWFNSKLKVLASNRKAVIFATHLLAEAEAVVDRCVFLQEGRIIYEGEISDVLASVQHLERYSRLEKSRLGDNEVQDVDIVFRDSEWLYVYDPKGTLKESQRLLSSEFGDQNVGRVSLPALYRLKTHNFRISGDPRR